MKVVKDIAHRPVAVEVKVRRNMTNKDIWLIQPNLTAFPDSQSPKPKNIIFILDISSSMKGERIKLVKIAIGKLLDQLNNQDTFSIIAFNSDARLIANHNVASQDNINVAKNNLNQVVLNRETNFAAGFALVKKHKLIRSAAVTTILFLTDGNDKNCTVENLLKLVTYNNCLPQIIPLGIKLNPNSYGNNFLSRLAELANKGNIKPIFINYDNEHSYLNAFQEAYKLAAEHSKSAAKIEIVIESVPGINISSAYFKRVLKPILYDGETPLTDTFYFGSPTPPAICKVRFSCDGVSLEANCPFKERDLTALQAGNEISFPVDKVTWVNNFRRWIMPICLGALPFLGVAGFLLAVTFIPLMFPLALGIGLGLPLIAFAGLIILAKGANNLSTFFLPTILTESGTENLKQQFLPLHSLQPGAMLSPVTAVPPSIKSHAQPGLFSQCRLNSCSKKQGIDDSIPASSTGLLRK